MTTLQQTIRLQLRSSRRYANPYLDVDPTVEFRGPDDAIVRRPVYWDGEDEWGVSFVAPAAGTWSYRIAEPTGDAGFDSFAGEVVVEPGPPPSTSRFLRASATGRYLETSAGAPFFWLADTHWRFAWEPWEDSAKAGWTSRFRGIVDLRVEQGFTVYQSNILSFGTGRESPLWRPGHPFAEIDIDYVREVLDPRMAYIAESGLVHAVGLAWFPAVDHHLEGLRRFARYIVARYGTAPIVWTLGGEVAGYDPELRARRIDGWRQVAKAIRHADDYRHPITAHQTNERPVADHYQGDDWLSFTLHQHGHGDLDLSPSHYREHLNRYPDLPLVEGESMYEGITSVEPVGRRTATDTMVRQIAYRAIQSGCCGYSYGAQGCWNNDDDEASGESMWGSTPWHVGVDLPGAVQMGHLRRLYESVAWFDLAPVDDVFDAGGAVNAVYYPPVVTADGRRDTVVAYFGETYRNEEGSPTLVGLASATHRLDWFDPRTGAWLAVEHHTDTHDGSLAVPPKPTESDDWVLVARRTR